MENKPFQFGLSAMMACVIAFAVIFGLARVSPAVPVVVLAIVTVSVVGAFLAFAHSESKVIRRLTYVATACVMVIGAAGIGWLCRGLTVDVWNSGTDTCRSVIVHVTGRSYALGTLQPNDRRSVRVKPVSDSHVELTFVDESGINKRVLADVYLEPAYRGTVTIELLPNGVASVKDNVSAYPASLTTIY